MKSIYNLVDRDTKVFLSEPTLQRSLARATKQSLKQLGIDAIIISSKLDRDQAKTIR